MIKLFAYLHAAGPHSTASIRLHQRCRMALTRQMDVSENRGTPKSSILIGFSSIKHPFWGTPIFGNTQIFIVIDTPPKLETVRL